MATLETLNFDNKALRDLPVDPNEEIRVRQVSGACFSKVQPTPVKNPELVACSLPALQLLDVVPSETERSDIAEYFSGNKLLPGSQPAAHCYCGHQFGVFAGQLGDGAAMYLGEIVNKAGQRWEIQLKGAGFTPFSRTADGRKVLRSTIREFLCSEAMHHLGIPTTRAGSCVTSDSVVIRDIFYDGHPKEERCSVVLRIAETFLRFGSFEIFKPVDEETGRQGPSVGRTDILKQLLNYTVSTFYPQIWQRHQNIDDKQEMYIEMFQEVLRRTARLAAEWQCVGFCHGVLNTDNMSIVGVTIDYGPFGFMDRYDPDFICNASDDGGRYSYKNQPEICKWNCLKLAEAIQDCVPLSRTKPELEIFDEEFKRTLYQQDETEGKRGSIKLVEELLMTMKETGADFTNSFRCLSHLPLPGTTSFKERQEEVLTYLLTQCSTVEELKKSFRPRMDPKQLQTLFVLMQTNPSLLAVLGRGFGALQAELERIEKLGELEGVTQEVKKSEDEQKWKEWLEKYTARLLMETDGLCETPLESAVEERVKVMNANNPRIVLRNYITQSAIDAAERGDFMEVRRVLKMLENPYTPLDQSPHVLMSPAGAGADSLAVGAEAAASDCKGAEGSTGHSGHASRVLATYDCKPPDWSLDLRVT
ncbi:hypothetical protein C0Q70_04281 [Pomacea canaliculata]|uniref:Selenoprotein O n=1 Tax=Pomacea canaliculata TaxID=400727 RepID=A0A2T7PV30_POMCA|nr:hypothetical protein C0Q70_04281 [Pomacea canaliculata]